MSASPQDSWSDEPEILSYTCSKTIIATASTSEKLDFLLKLGATRAVNYKTQDFAAEVKEATGGKGVEVLIDFVGKSHWHKNIDSLAFDGRMTMLAFLSGELTSQNHRCISDTTIIALLHAPIATVSPLDPRPNRL